MQDTETQQCQRCGREPTDQSGNTLSPGGYCIVCHSKRLRQAVDALDWTVYRRLSIIRGEWYGPDETPPDGRQATLTEQ